MALTKLQKKFAEGIALGMKQGQAARYAGYSDKVADNLATENMKNSEILEQIDKLQEVKKQALRRRFQGMAEVAFDELIHVLKDVDASPQARLNAAKMILDYAGMEEPKQLNVTADVNQSNPFEGLTTDELRKLIDDV
ncbi:terminase small subunit [uncultured Streptococcus sp.]|uniref:terminase small subunit n=1 Tax=uncultured Streptococcus sp. TaxID=83427 RepID=UPI0027DB19CD|nr:terminase small subunit [uncultured Streptococcus sp.]